MIDTHPLWQRLLNWKAWQLSLDGIPTDKPQTHDSNNIDFVVTDLCDAEFCIERVLAKYRIDNPFSFRMITSHLLKRDYNASDDDLIAICDDLAPLVEEYPSPC